MRRLTFCGAHLLIALTACGGGSEVTPETVPSFGLPGGDGTSMSSPSAGAAASRGGAPGTSGAGSPAAGAVGEGAPSPSLGASTGATGAPPASTASTALPRSTPEAEGVSSSAVLALVRALDTQIDEVHSLMLVRHGKVVAEGWWQPYAPEDIHVTYSVSKSVNATAVGLAIGEGLLGLDDLLVDRFADLAPAAPAPNMASMRVRHLLSMATGHTSDTMNTLRARGDGQWTRAFLEADVQNPPGTSFLYNSGAAYTLASLVQRVTGMTVEEYLEPRLFAPLGIERTLWGASPEGVNLGDGGLSLRTEDLAKFGLLYLRGGMWDGAQVLPPEWVAQATTSQVSSGNGDGNWSHGYGFQFWMSRFGYRADGSLGQFVFVLPEEDAVLVITSGTDNSTGTNTVMNLVWDNLLPAFAPEALPEDASAQGELSAALGGLALPVPQGSLESPLAADVSGRRYAVAQNAQGITALELDLGTSPPTLAIEDADGLHAVQVGLGAWVRQRTGFKKRINELFDTPEQGLAAIGAWTAPDTFVARLCFNETPYTLTASLRFAGEQVFVDMSYNVRWGATSEPQIVGTR